MYLQFDREKLTTLVDRWLHNIFRLDATLTTVADVDAKYGRRVEEFYNAPLDQGTRRLDVRWRSRSPIVFATSLIAIGWILVLLKPGLEPLVRRSDFPGGQYVRELFTPMPTAVDFAFLGAYSFTLQTVFRGYVRGDLRPKTYNTVSTRIIWAVILAWVLETLIGPDNEAVFALAFFAGIVPETVLRVIWDLTARAYRLAVPKWGRQGYGQEEAGGIGDYPLEERAPLSELDGMDLYDRTRLNEEGITNVQALARHDFVDLMLSTRIPVARLVDWVDQALLYQHLGRRDRGHLLRRYGIRTATELLHVARPEIQLPVQAENGPAGHAIRWSLARKLILARGGSSRSPSGRGRTSAAANTVLVHPLAPLLENDDEGIRLRVVCYALEDDEWLPFLRTWRRSQQQEPPAEKSFGPNREHSRPFR